MSLGTALLFAGVGLTLVAIATTSTAVFFLGTTVAGSGFGAAFQGSIRTVVPLAEPHQRSGLLSILYVVSYFSMGLPAVVAGYLVVHDGGLLDTARSYGVAVMVLALLALLLPVVHARRTSLAAERTTSLATARTMTRPTPLPQPLCSAVRADTAG
jgi:MFS family permease